MSRPNCYDHLMMLIYVIYMEYLTTLVLLFYQTGYESVVRSAVLVDGILQNWKQHLSNPRVHDLSHKGKVCNALSL